MWHVIESLLPAGIGFDTMAGLISGMPSEIQTGSIMIEAYDPTWPVNRASVTLFLTIHAPEFVVTMPAVPGAQVGLAFVLTPTVSGAIGSPTWSVVTGTLPSGVALAAFSGAIAGTPSSWGSFTALVEAQDSWGEARIDAKPVTIVVAPAALTISTTTLASGMYNSAYQAAMTATGGTGLTTWTLSDGALPAGLTLAANGAINGTPMAVGTFTFTVAAADAGWAGTGATRVLSITVGAGEIVLYAADATRIAGTWSLVPDASAAGGARVWNPDAAAPKLPVALASPANYVELTFQVEAGVAYHLWARGKADN